MRERNGTRWVPDAWREEWQREYEADGCTPLLEVVCDDPDHIVEWSSASLYLARKRAGLGRADVRDRLRAAGHRVTIARIMRWESYGDERDAEPTTTELRALARVLGVRPGALLGCGACEYAHLRRVDPEYARRMDESSAEIHTQRPEPIDMREILSRVKEARRREGLTMLKLARAAGVDVGDVVAIERLAVKGLGINPFLRVLDALDLGTDGNPDAGGDGDDGPHGPAEDGPGGVDVAEELVGATA